MKLSELTEYFEPSLYEMSTYGSTRTGLSPGVELWGRTEPKGLPHTKYRIKIGHPQNGAAVFALWGDESIQVAGNWTVSGKELKKIQQLIALNIDHLRNHIDGIEDSGDVSDAFTKTKQHNTLR